MLSWAWGIQIVFFLLTFFALFQGLSSEYNRHDFVLSYKQGKDDRRYDCHSIEEEFKLAVENFDLQGR